MPDADGYEFCKWVKNDERTSHIPVLLLTALKSRENEIEGLSCGADDYITKPFDLSILETKINNIAEMREALKKRYTGNLRFEPENVKVASPDEKFIKRVMQVAEKNIPNSELDIEKFAAEVGVSRMQLYRKLSALTDMTVKEFIRNIRLKRAVQLLEQKTMTVSEVAYSVGFKDLSHFRKCFKQQYGMTASEYSKNKQG
jgi:AraC-like DNA-binding protein